jgi:hypothetical protein
MLRKICEWMKWVGHMACTEERRGADRAVVGKHKGKRPLRRPRNRWMILKRIFKNGHGLNRSGSGQRQVAVSCDYSNEPLGSIKCGNFTD